MKPNGEQDPLPAYDPARAVTRVSPIAVWAAHPPQWFWWVLRKLCPIPRLFRWAAVTRYDDVAEVLARSDVFRVPFGAEIARLNNGQSPGTPFILGIDDRSDHDLQLALVMQAFRRADVDTAVRSVSSDFAKTQLAKAAGNRVDAIPALITGAPLAVCQSYYGIAMDDPQKFAYATIDVSGHLFGLPPIERDPKIDVAAGYVRAVVDRSINAELAAPASRDTVLARLVALHRKDPVQLPLEQVRGFLIGMIIGFVPTNTMAGGHILEMLLRKRQFLQPARQAALAGDDDLLRHCLFEAMRFWPLNPGPFRICARDYTVAAGTPRAATIKKGSMVLASTMSAMLDERQLRNPGVFDPQRPASNYMLFGYGMHWCVGFFIAQAQIAETFKPLLMLSDVRRAKGKDGKLKLRGLFPDHLHVQWGAST